jgi:hypothetical protein
MRALGWRAHTGLREGVQLAYADAPFRRTMESLSPEGQA